METQTLLTAKVSHVYRMFLIPTVLGMMTQSLYCLADVVFIALGAGSVGLAAMNIVMPIFTFYTAIGLLLGIGGATTISVCLGQNDHDQANRALTTVVVLNLAIGIIASVLTTVFMDQFAMMLGATPGLLPYVRSYMAPINCVNFAYILSSAMQVIIRNDNNPRLVMVGTVIANLFNIVADWIFVLGFGWGIFGAGLATAISPFLALGIMSLHYIRKQNHVKFVRHFFSFPLLHRIIKNGLAAALLELCAGLVILLFNKVLLRLGGELYIASYAIISNIAYVGKSIFNGIAQAAQPIISINHGAGNPERVKQARQISIKVAIVVSGVAYLLFFLFPEFVIRPFASGDLQLLEVTVPALRLYFSSFIFTAVNTILMYYFQSIEKAFLSTVISLMRGIILISVGLFVLTSWIGIDGVWLTMTFAEFFTLLLAIPMLSSRQSQRNRPKIQNSEEQ